ncbi:MAG: hypothetical protein JWM09_1537, partial [Francisellaceae bacterium]|nr:hypothetical protein [Francisellaceae bacterium]
MVNGNKKMIFSFIILVNAEPVGLIQYYNALDFERDGYKLENI